MSGKHPIHVHPARPLYRFTATALGASMWFFVRLIYPHRETQGLLQGISGDVY